MRTLHLLVPLAVMVAALGLEIGAPSVEGAFPGANGKIVFQTTRHGGSGLEELYVMNNDGTNQTRCTNNSAFDGNARWSPDGTRIAFTSTRDGDGEIYVMNADCATGLTQLTSNSFQEGTPDWSPDGTMIVFFSDRDGNNEIYKMNADGTGQIRLTNNSAVETYPVWSPDGTKIAFHSNRDGTFQIYKMNADGTAQARCTNNTFDDVQPDWSPDGTKFVFRSDRDGNSNIYKMNSDCTGTAIQLTFSVGNDIPRWSPDGTMIVFHRVSASNESEIFKMNADGSGEVNLTNVPAHDGTADWQPVVSAPVGGIAVEPDPSTLPLEAARSSGPGVGVLAGVAAAAAGAIAVCGAVAWGVRRRARRA